MTECTQSELSFPSCTSKKVTVDFSGGHIRSVDGSLLLAQADRQRRLTRQAARLIPDPRNQVLVTHKLEQMLRQRVYAIGCGEEDLNDHDELRREMALQAAAGTDGVLASSSTLCRFENRAQRKAAFDLNALRVDQFIASQKVPPDSTLMQPMMLCTATRRDVSFMATTTLTASSRCMSSATRSCSAPLCGQKVRSVRNMRVNPARTQFPYRRRSAGVRHFASLTYCISCKRLIDDPLVRFLRRGILVTNLTGGDDVSYEPKSEGGAGG